jgi:type I restriction enzyme M protein
MEAVVVTLRARKPAARRGKVLFINALNEVTREQANSFLCPSHQTKILDAYQLFRNIDEFAALATSDEMARKNFSLALPLYIASTSAPDVRVGVPEAVHDWRISILRSEATFAEVLALLRQEMTP